MKTLRFLETIAIRICKNAIVVLIPQYFFAINTVRKPMVRTPQKHKIITSKNNLIWPCWISKFSTVHIKVQISRKEIITTKTYMYGESLFLWFMTKVVPQRQIGNVIGNWKCFISELHLPATLATAVTCDLAPCRHLDATSNTSQKTEGRGLRFRGG